MTTEHNKTWEKLGSKLLQKTRVFDLYVQRLRAHHKNHEDDFYYFDVRNWVNIIPITESDEVVLVKQYRFGIHEYSLEIPGGILDKAEEEPMQGAIRELREETGYEPESTIPLGFVHPNPAIQNNRMYYYLAKNVRLVGKQNLDPAEDISVHLMPISQIPKMIKSEEITHSLTICAFFLYFFRHIKE